MAGSVDTWTDLGTAVDGIKLQGRRNTTLGTGTMDIRLIRTTSRDLVRVIWAKSGIADATWDAWLAVFEV